MSLIIHFGIPEVKSKNKFIKNENEIEISRVGFPYFYYPQESLTECDIKIRITIMYVGATFIMSIFTTKLSSNPSNYFFNVQSKQYIEIVGSNQVRTNNYYLTLRAGQLDEAAISEGKEQIATALAQTNTSGRAIKLATKGARLVVKSAKNVGKGVVLVKDKLNSITPETASKAFNLMSRIYLEYNRARPIPGVVLPLYLT